MPLINPSDYLSSRNMPSPQTEMDTSLTGSPKLLPQDDIPQQIMHLPYVPESHQARVDTTRSPFQQFESLPQDTQSRPLRHKMKVVDFTKLLNPMQIRKDN